MIHDVGGWATAAFIDLPIRTGAHSDTPSSKKEKHSLEVENVIITCHGTSRWILLQVGTKVVIIYLHQVIPEKVYSELLTRKIARVSVTTIFYFTSILYQASGYTKY